MNTEILNKACSCLPYTLAHPLHGMATQAENGNWSGAMNYMLDFFETSTMYLSVVLLAMLKETEDPQECPEIIKAVGKIDNKRPLSFGDWSQDILTPLAAAAAQRLEGNVFAQSLNKALAKDKLLIGKKNERSVIKIRNEYKGHSTTRSMNIYQGIVEELSGRLEKFIEALDPLGEMEFIGVSDGKAYRLNGHNAAETEADPTLQDRHYYIRYGDITLDLFPLLYCNENGYVYIFQTLKDEETAYISSNEEAATWTGESLNAEFDSWMQVLVPSFDIAKTLNWEQWLELMQGNTSGYLDRIYAEKKYNRELFVERESLSAMLDGFLGSDSLIFPLLGEAGQGKTTQLCYWTETFSEAEEGVMIFAGADFAEQNLEQRLKDEYGWAQHKPIAKLTDSLANAARTKGKTVLILFDAINECINYPGLEIDSDGPLMLYKDIYRIFIEPGYTEFKILFTCRNFTWKNLLMPVMSRQNPALFYNAGEEENTAVKGFTDSEVENAYHIYGELYQMKSPFEELPRGTTIRLKDPLVLKMACTNYLGHEFPTAMREFTSLALFHKMMQDISLSYAGNRQVEIVREMARLMLEAYRRGDATDSIMMSDLRRDYDSPEAPFYTLARLIIKKDGHTVAFRELLNKPERPILRLVENEKIQFIYERFLEYLLALTYFESETVSAEGIIKTVTEATANEVFMGAMRNILMMSYIATGSPTVLIQLSNSAEAGFEIPALVTDVMNVMVKENYEDEIFKLLDSFIKTTDQACLKAIPEYNAVIRTIESNKADDKTIARHNELSAVMEPVIRQRSIASVTLINGIFLTDYHNEGIYSKDPFTLLWGLLADPISEVKNNVCMHAYYASNKKFTLSGMPLRENISEQIVNRMYREVNSTPLIAIPIGAERRSLMLGHLIVGTQLNVLLIIDALISGNDEDRQRVGKLLQGTIDVFKHLTAGFSLVKVLMPFFQMVMRKQLTFQADYVNNVIEYQTFWDDNVIPRHSDSCWCREDMKTAIQYIFQYSKYYAPGKNPAEAPDFKPFVEKVVSAYRTGDSFSYFAFERILIIIGLCSWEDIYPLLKAFRDGGIRGTEYYDYSQMSLIYVLYQLGLKMETFPEFAMDMLSEWCEEWTLKCRGFFKGRNSHKANPRQLYKRNVMTWYAMVWAVRHGDVQDPSCSNAPLFRRLIDMAIETRDKELLVHLIENISELVADSGYIYTALDLLHQVLSRIDRQEILDELDEKADLRYSNTEQDIVTLIGKVLGTAKNYFPAEVNAFLKRDITGLTFPGIPKYKDEILSYNPGGEKLSDLLTHKFGNFLIWSLIHEEAVDNFAYEAMCLAPDSKDSFEWFDKVVRVLFVHLFKVKL